jgi:hypothetical protein
VAYSRRAIDIASATSSGRSASRMSVRLRFISRSDRAPISVAISACRLDTGGHRFFGREAQVTRESGETELLRVACWRSVEQGAQLRWIKLAFLARAPMVHSSYGEVNRCSCRAKNAVKVSSRSGRLRQAVHRAGSGPVRFGSNVVPQSPQVTRGLTREREYPRRYAARHARRHVLQRRAWRGMDVPQAHIANW